MDDAKEYALQSRLCDAIAPNYVQVQDGKPGDQRHKLIRSTVRGEILSRQLDAPPALPSQDGVFCIHHIRASIPIRAKVRKHEIAQNGHRFTLLRIR